MRFSRYFWIGAACAAWALSSSPAQAQPYPSRPVRIINPAPAGNGPDVIGRVVAERLARAWGQQVVTINRPGAGGLLAAQAAVGAERDGYTLYQANTSSLLVLPETQKLSFDFSRDFAPIGLVGEQPLLVAVSPALGVRTLAELVAAAKRDRIMYAAAVRGSLPHLTGELFRARAGIDLTFVPYPSTPQSLHDIRGGRIPMIVEAAAVLSAAIADGTLRPLAVTADKRLPEFPEIPTASEVLPQRLVATAFFPLFAPAGTPEEIIQKLSRDLRTVLEQPDLQKQLASLGTYVRPMTPSETATFIREQQEQWRPIVKQMDLK